MESQVEKMYENADVKKQIPKVCSSNELYCKECEAHIEDAMPYCKNAEYPPFTAEKQLELIKWLAKRPLTLLIGRYKGKYYFGNSNFNSKADSFDNAIAIRINDLWQSLTEEEKQQVKGILE